MPVHCEFAVTIQGIKKPEIPNHFSRLLDRRMDGSADFYLDWVAYKTGFGNLNGEFWLGNNNLHRMTAAEEMKLRVALEDFEGDVRYAEYTTFKVADEGNKYRLRIGGYNGTAGDSLLSKQSAK